MCVLALIVSSPHQTTRSEFDASEYEVRRRYQDFLWLRSKLEENHPTLIISVRDGQVQKKSIYLFLMNDPEDPNMLNLHDPGCVCV